MFISVDGRRYPTPAIIPTTGALVRTISVAVHPNQGTRTIDTIIIIITITTGMDITRDTAMVRLIRLLSRAMTITSVCTLGLGFLSIKIPRRVLKQLPTRGTSTIFTLGSTFLATNPIAGDHQSATLDVSSRFITTARAGLRSKLVQF